MFLISCGAVMTWKQIQIPVVQYVLSWQNSDVWHILIFNQGVTKRLFTVWSECKSTQTLFDTLKFKLWTPDGWRVLKVNSNYEVLKIGKRQKSENSSPNYKLEYEK